MKKGKIIICFISLFIVSAVLSIVLAGVPSDYYVSNSGEDNNDGRTVSTPWRTIAKVNESSFSPGATIHFERGGVWRENLYPRSGDETGYIKYISYGDEEKPKPVILGSQNKNKAEDWTDEGGNIWSTRLPSVAGSELLLNPSFDESHINWQLSLSGGAIASGGRDTIVYDSSPAGYKVTCGSNNGTSSADIKLFARLSRIDAGKYYELSFRSKVDQAFEIYPINLMQGDSQAYWNFYTGTPLRLKYLISANVTTEWKTYKVYYQANRSAADAKVVFSLGNSLLENSNFYIDSLSFKELAEVPFLIDVGNIIFDDGQNISFKVWQSSDLNQQNEFWYDEDNMILKVYSLQNPAVLYQNIECALNRDIIEESHKHHIIYENLYLAYGAYDAIGGGYSHDITVRNCDMCFIGGGDQYGGVNTIRYGNGVEFWNEASNILVEGCNIWEVFDNALTNQGSGAGESQANIIYRNNKMWNCERTFEAWFNAGTGTMSDIYFENNLLLNAGGGWGHQRFPGESPAGRHITLGRAPGGASNIYIRNNIVSKADWSCINLSRTWAFQSYNLENLVMDNNTYYQPANSGRIAFCYNYGSGTEKHYYNNNFGQYKADTGKDANSILHESEYISIEVLYSDPANGAVDVAKDKVITVAFSQDIKPYCDYARISLKDSGGKLMQISKSINSDSLLIAPASLECGNTYSVFIPIGSVASLDSSKILSKDYRFSFTAASSDPDNPPEDVNNDGRVNVEDLQACVNHILGAQDWGQAADVNKDDKIDVMDVIQIINVILGNN